GNDLDPVPKLLELPSPIESTGGSLDSDQARGQLTDDFEQLFTMDSARERCATFVIDAMQLEDVLRQVDTYYADLFHSNTALLHGSPAIPRQLAGAVHPIKWKPSMAAWKCRTRRSLKGWRTRTAG